MSTDSRQVAGITLPVGQRQCSNVLKGVLPTLVLLMMSACSDEPAQQQSEQRPDKPPQAIVVQIPVAQLPPQVVQPQYLAPPQQQGRAVETDSSNPWAVRSQPKHTGQYRTQQWGQPQPPQPQYTQPATGSRYRPLETEQPAERSRVPAVQQPVPVYRPVAPYDRLSGSSFGTPAYPAYGRGVYPGYYPGPGGVYAPPWPGMGWPGYW